MLALIILFLALILGMVADKFFKDYGECNKRLCEQKYGGEYFISECFNSAMSPCTKKQLYDNCELNDGTTISVGCNLT